MVELHKRHDGTRCKNIFIPYDAKSVPKRFTLRTRSNRNHNFEQERIFAKDGVQIKSYFRGIKQVAKSRNTAISPDRTKNPNIINKNDS